MRRITLPVDSAARKGYPLWRGCFAYFAAALAGVARWSKKGNDKHNPGEPMHHARGKSNDHMDCIPRHLFDIGDLLAYYERNTLEGESADQWEAMLLDEADALAWRALALSQELHERFGCSPLAPGARLPAPERHPHVVNALRRMADREGGPLRRAARKIAAKNR